MPDHPNSRTKMLTLRLSEAEFQTLKSQFRNHGASSVSDLARLAIQQVITGVSVRELDSKFKEIDIRLNALEAAVLPHHNNI